MKAIIQRKSDQVGDKINAVLGYTLAGVVIFALVGYFFNNDFYSAFIWLYEVFYSILSAVFSFIEYIANKLSSIPIVNEIFGTGVSE